MDRVIASCVKEKATRMVASVVRCCLPYQAMMSMNVKSATATASALHATAAAK
jgi:hypothetical protein